MTYDETPTQNAYTMARHLRAVATQARECDFTRVPQDHALYWLTEWLKETRTLQAFDAWLDGVKEGREG